MSTNRGMDKDVVPKYSRILLSHKIEQNSAISATWMDLETVMLSELSQTEKEIQYDTI